MENRLFSINTSASTTPMSSSSELNSHPNEKKFGFLGRSNFYSGKDPTLLEESKWKINWCNFFSRFVNYLRPKPMPLEHSLTLNWWLKWKLYRRFPWKFLIHTLITIFCTAQVLVISTQNTNYNVSNFATFYRVFYPPDFNPSYGFIVPSDTLYAYSISDCIRILNGSVQNYFTFPSWSVDVYHLDSSSPNPYLKATAYTVGDSVFDPSQAHVDTSTVTREYELTLNSLGPLSANNDTLQSFFHALVYMEVNFTIYSVMLIGNHPIEHKWAITMKYDFSDRAGRIAINLDIVRLSIAISVSFWELFGFLQVSLSVALILLCTLSTIFSLNSMRHSFAIYQRIKNRFNSIRGPIIAWNAIPLRLKFKFFNIWFILSIVANFFLTAACCFDIANNFGPEAVVDEIVKLLLGIGTLLAWVNMMRYLEFDSKYTVLIHALGRGMPNVMRFIVSASPIFMGYCLFGVIYFSEDTQRFQNLDQASLTLFSLQNGDDIQNSIRSTDVHWIISRLYFYTFIFISIYALANIFIAIIEDAYFSGKDTEDSNDNPKLKQTQGEKFEKNNGSIHRINSSGSSKPKSRTRGKTINREMDLQSNDDLWNQILAIHRNSSTDSSSPFLNDNYDHNHENDTTTTTNNNNTGPNIASNIKYNDNYTNSYSANKNFQEKEEEEKPDVNLEGYPMDTHSNRFGRHLNREELSSLKQGITHLVQEQQQQFASQLQQSIQRLLEEKLEHLQ